MNEEKPYYTPFHEQNHQLDAKVCFAQKAKDQRKWIFDKTTKYWYSPNEFIKDITVFVPIHKYKPNYSNWEILDPRDYIYVRRAKVNELLKEIETMEKRMWQYYNLVPKK